MLFWNCWWFRWKKACTYIAYFNFWIFHIDCIPHTCHYNHAFGCHCCCCFLFVYVTMQMCTVCLHFCNAPLFIQIIRIESSLNNKNGNKKVAFIIGNGDKIYAYEERFSFFRQFRVVQSTRKCTHAIQLFITIGNHFFVLFLVFWLR